MSYKLKLLCAVLATAIAAISPVTSSKADIDHVLDHLIKYDVSLTTGNTSLTGEFRTNVTGTLTGPPSGGGASCPTCYYAYDLIATVGTESVELTYEDVTDLIPGLSGPGNSALEVLGSGLSDDGTNLYFDFSGASTGVVDMFNSNIVQFCGPNVVGGCPGTPGIYITIADPSSGFISPPDSGIIGTATPLPASLPLFATGLGGLGLLGWRRKRRAQAAA